MFFVDLLKKMHYDSSIKKKSLLKLFSMAARREKK